MNTEKTLASLSTLLADIATEISQTCSTRNSILNIYLGSGLPQLQLDLFKPILLENYALVCSFLKDEKLTKTLHADIGEIAKSLDLSPSTFQHARVQEYAHAKDPTALYTKFCMFVLHNRANATSSKALQDDYREKLSSNTPLALQLGVQRMREAAEVV